jgi:G:T-mismatch repair DNA endonuclease (very short patch repair protein)
MIIKKSLWTICKVDGEDIKKRGRSGKYYTDIFKEHLDSLGISLLDYFTKYCNLKPPICPCGICKKEVGITKIGANFYWKKMACGRNKGLIKWSEEAKINRIGENNPMYNKTPWNKGKNKENNIILKSISERRKGRITPEHVKLKQSQSAKKRLIHGHTGRTHSIEEKNRMRKRTLERIKNGDFAKTNTKPHQELKNILENLQLNYEEEKILSYWSFDFYLTDYDIYIEVDGDYWHSNPKFYPDGPKTKSQKINYSRDISKNNFCNRNNIKLVRFWENDLIQNKKEIICKLEELLMLKK